MTDDVEKPQWRESLSALMDDAADEMALHRLLKQAESDDDLRRTWNRYQLASAAIRRDAPAAPVNIADAVRAAVAEEAAPRGNWWQPLGRVAVAASVAVAVVVGAQFAGPGGSSEAVVAERAPAMSTETNQPPVGFGGFDLNARTVSTAEQPALNNASPAGQPLVIRQPQNNAHTPSPALQRHFNLLMLEHSENAALNSGRGMLPFARIAELRDEAP